MSNSNLDRRALSLERDLAPKLKCYVRVGWAKESNGSVTYMVYVDQRADIDYSVLPRDWHGDTVLLQLALPPGV